jgi:hypothetical protein
MQMVPLLTIDRAKKTVTVVMPLETAHPSKATGKTRLIASTHGSKVSQAFYFRRPVCFTANVFFYPQDSKSNQRGGSQGSETRSSLKVEARKPRRSRDEKSELRKHKPKLRSRIDQEDDLHHPVEEDSDEE